MNKLRNWREQQRLTQKEAADRFGSDQASVSLWESGARGIPKSKLERVHRVTRIPLRQLLSLKSQL
ncbi:helix-turn-helix domain-containing protein [Chromobacterium subtsugae]|uniref:helix-turn-helix domain-containing protein n=1 Tax=Chromobacterium subtsugae TaxID=251747 RepID=UPI0009BFE147|nr:helix-turn-helix transcriptional regulator [Chromobacterium subtsugae]